ncbi:hypothetical protein F5B21DRAFT_488447 [Xylaria acuta]|nr:hypothetical protein F5B21DRAFT_488447 [Xylaria acuta]
MTEQPPGSPLPDTAQSTTAGVPAPTTSTATPTPTPTPKPPAAPVTTPATVTLATPPAGSIDNGDNTAATPTPGPQQQQRGKPRQQPAILPRHPPPLAPAPTSARKQTNKDRQPSPPQRQQPPLQPPPPHFHPYYSLTPETTSDQFYDILRELDPYRTTPKEFIHLLVHAATRDGEIAQALVRLNSDRIKNPSTWQPPLPPTFAAQPPAPSHFPSQPWPGTATPISHPPNVHTSTSAAPVSAQEYATSLIHPRKRRRIEAAEQHAAPTPATSRFRVNCHRMVMFSGPQQPPPPATHAKQPWNPTIVQVDAAAAQRLPPTPLSGQQGVPSPATTSTALPVISVQSVASSK